MGKKRLEYGYIKKNFESHGWILLKNYYINCKTRMECICNNGHKIKIRWNNFMSGQRCKICANIKSSKSKKLDGQYVQEYFEKNGCVLLNDYIDSSTKMEYRCVCGNTSFINFNNFQKGHRCKKCGNKKLSENQVGMKNHGWNINRKQIEMNRKIKVLCHSILKHTTENTGQKKNTKTELLLGYTKYQLLEHLQKDPNFDKWTKDSRRWHIDHIIPIKAFVEHNITDPKIINSLDNLRIISAKENISKNGKFNEDVFSSYLNKKGIYIND